MPESVRERYAIGYWIALFHKCNEELADDGDERGLFRLAGGDRMILESILGNDLSWDGTSAVPPPRLVSFSVRVFGS